MSTSTMHQEHRLGSLAGKRIAIVGYGSQGRAHALNLRDSRHDVVVGLRPGGPTFARAVADGFTPVAPAEAVREANLVAMLVPDTAQPALFRDHVAPTLKRGAAVLFAHGFNVHFGQIRPTQDVDVVLVAPKGPGDFVRRQYVDGHGVPCLVAVAQDASGEALGRAMAYADGLGGTRAGVLQTTFAEETETDLFGEQAVLLGGVTELVLAGFETLVDAGYRPEVAYFECLHELKLIVDLMYEQGISGMRYSISTTAEYGDLVTGPRIINQAVKAAMKAALEDIQSGRFAEQFVNEIRSGGENFEALRQQGKDHQIEQVGAELRGMMPWISAGKAKVEDISGGD